MTATTNSDRGFILLHAQTPLGAITLEGSRVLYREWIAEPHQAPIEIDTLPEHEITALLAAGVIRRTHG